MTGRGVLAGRPAGVGSCAVHSPPHRGVWSPEASLDSHSVSFSKSRWVLRRVWTVPCFRWWLGSAHSTLQCALVGLGPRTQLFLTPPQLPESQPGGVNLLGPSWVPHLGRSGPQARSLVRACLSHWRRLADSSFFLMPIKAKFLFGDSDGPVPLPVWAKWGGRPRPAPSPFVGVHAPTLATTGPLPLLPSPQSTR